MSKFTTESLVLKHFDLGEADKIITFYTRDRGKVRAVAGGARKARSRVSGLVQPFSYNRITVYCGKSIPRINHIENIFSFTDLREDFTKMIYASYMAEFVDKVGMEDDPNRALFSLLLSTFHKILHAEREDLNYLLLGFKIRALGILGFRPELEDCQECKGRIKPLAENYFSIPVGGLLCPRCYQPGENIFTLSGEALQVMKKLITAGLENPLNLKPSAAACRQLDMLINRFILYHLDIKLKSEKFLHMIEDLG